MAETPIMRSEATGTALDPTSPTFWDDLLGEGEGEPAPSPQPTSRPPSEPEPSTTQTPSPSRATSSTPADAPTLPSPQPNAEGKALLQKSLASMADAGRQFRETELPAIRARAGRPVSEFDARAHLTSLDGRDYLEVKWRIMWLRTEQPDAVIETALHRDDGATAVFKAKVTLPSGAGATGWGQETYQDFRDYVEKAETKALGRALAALGFGTQFTVDLDGPPPEVRGRVDQSAGYAPRTSTGARPSGGAGTAASDAQVAAILAIGGKLGRKRDELEAECYGRCGVATLGQLSRQQASSYIDFLKAQQGQ